MAEPEIHNDIIAYSIEIHPMVPTRSIVGGQVRIRKGQHI